MRYNYYLCLLLTSLLILTNTAQGRRRSRGRGRRRGSRVQQQQPWEPQHVSQQGSGQQNIEWNMDPWTPQVSGHGVSNSNPWTPQTTNERPHLQFPGEERPELQFPVDGRPHLQFPEDPWMPSSVNTNQVEIQFPEQQPLPDDCVFDYDEVPESHEHSFIVSARSKEVIYPDRVGLARVILIPEGTRVIAACPGPDNKLGISGRSYSYLTCRNSLLFYGRKIALWSDLGCQEKPKPMLRAEGSCGEGGMSVVVGWDIRRNLFLPQITLCFDQMQETTRFASHKIHGRYIDAKVIESSRPSFKKNDMFSISIRNSYRKARQRALLQRILNTTEHLTGRGQHYLARGHLAPDADFVLEAEQDATYYYANAVPQWQAVNNGNWKKLEGQVRELAEKRPWPLEVWTGTHGTLELPNQVTNNPVMLFLGLSENEEVVPVPALLWKVIHDPRLHQAVAIVMVNDVRGRGTSDSWRLDGPPCRNLCNHLQWVDWDVNDITRGMTFCCTVDALRRTITDLPVLGRVSLLQA